MSSSKYSRVPPSVHQACHSLIPRIFFFLFFSFVKAQGFDSSALEAWRFFFGCFLWFSALEITRLLFWYHIGYSEVLASHESGLLLIGASAFSVPILTFLSVSVVYSGRFPLVLSFFSVTAPNHSRQTSYITLQKDDNWWSMGPLMGGEQKRKLLV